MQKIMSPFEHINSIVKEIQVLQAGYDILEKLYIFYHMSDWNLNINGKPVDDVLKTKLRDYFKFDDSE